MNATLADQLELAARILRDPSLEWERRYVVVTTAAKPWTISVCDVEELLPHIIRGDVLIRLKPEEPKPHRPFQDEYGHWFMPIERRAKS